MLIGISLPLRLKERLCMEIQYDIERLTNSLIIRPKDYDYWVSQVPIGVELATIFRAARINNYLLYKREKHIEGICL